MNTLERDLINLLSAFLSSTEEDPLSLFCKYIVEPRPCNNLAEALHTNNWNYINELIHPIFEKDKHYYVEGRILLETSRRSLSKFKFDPTYGPPLSILDSMFITMRNNEHYLERCRNTFREANEPVVLPLVDHTPKVMHVCGGKKYWAHEPVVGSICSTIYNGNYCSLIVTDVVKAMEEILVSKITFINSTTVVYDNIIPKVSCKFSIEKRRWYNSDLTQNWELTFDMFIFR